MCESFFESSRDALEPYRRRVLLKRWLIALGVSAFYPVFPARSVFAQSNSANPAEKDLERKWMARAGEMKRIAVTAGDQPYGAVVVKDGRIVGEGPSRVVTNHDATAHAEMEAIRDASRRLGTGNLSGCILYGTSKPCRMCETAAYWANISRFVYGAGISDGGTPGYSSC